MASRNYQVPSTSSGALFPRVNRPWDVEEMMEQLYEEEHTQRCKDCVKKNITIKIFNKKLKEQGERDRSLIVQLENKLKKKTDTIKYITQYHKQHIQVYEKDVSSLRGKIGDLLRKESVQHIRELTDANQRLEQIKARVMGTDMEWIISGTERRVAEPRTDGRVPCGSCEMTCANLRGLIRHMVLEHNMSTSTPIQNNLEFMDDE